MGAARRWVLTLAVLVLIPTAAWAGRLFQWTDKKGQVHVTDNLWEVPADMRQRYLELIEEEARAKYTVAQIRDMKEAGDWPPLEFIRPKALKRTESDVNSLKLLADDAEIQRAMVDEYRFQWNTYYAERKSLTEEKATLEGALATAADNLLLLRQNEAATGVPPAWSKVPEFEKQVAALRARLAAVEAGIAALPAKEAQLWLGQRVFGGATADGGMGGFGPGAR